MVVKSRKFGKNDYLKILPEFQAFLLEHKFCPENQAPFYAYRIWQFQRFALDKADHTLDLKKKLFLEFLAQDNVADRQALQAEDALRIYFERFVDGENRSSTAVGDTSELLKKSR
jgi:hypothetical protein